MRLFKFASSFVKGLLLAAVLALMLAACSGAAPAPTQATSATPPQGPANPVHPTPQPSPTATPTPKPTPIPYSEMTGLQEMLAREFGAWPMLVASPKDGMLMGLGGNVQADKGEILAIYKVGDFYLVSDGQQASLVKPAELEQTLGISNLQAPAIGLSEAQVRAKIDHAKAWQAYLAYWKLPNHIDGLVDQNGNPVDLHKFFNDRNYAVKIVSYYLTHDRKAYDVYGNLVPIKPRTDLDPNRVVDALWALYNSRFDPDVSIFGSFGPTFWFGGPNITMEKMKQLHVGGNNAFFITPPYIDERGNFHTGLDWNVTRDSKVYSPFTQPAKMDYVKLWFDTRRYHNLQEAYDRGGLNASVHVIVTPPGGGKPVEFYFAHLDASKGSVLANLLLSNHIGILNAEPDYYAAGAKVYKIKVNGALQLQPGQAFATLDDPENDPWSLRPHIEFGVYPKIKDRRIATLMATAMLYHPNPEQYLPPLPPAPEQGYWLGKKHVASCQPTVPAVAVRQPDGTVVFANINPYKKEPGWKSQLSASARFSKYPKAAFRRRA